MIVITGTMYPYGSTSGAYEVLHGTITNTSPQMAETETYAAHFLSKPRKEIGVVGFEADVEVRGYDRRLGLVPLLSSILGAIEQTPMDFEPEIDLQAKLTLTELDEFDARLRGRS